MLFGKKGKYRKLPPRPARRGLGPALPRAGYTAPLPAVRPERMRPGPGGAPVPVHARGCLQNHRVPII